MTFLSSLFERLRPGRQRESVDLDPVEQLALRFLLHYGPQSADDVAREVSGTRAAGRADIDAALSRLVRVGLADEVAAGGEVRYAPTRKSAVLRDRIPMEPRGVTAFYL